MGEKSLASHHRLGDHKQRLLVTAILGLVAGCQSMQPPAPAPLPAPYASGPAPYASGPAPYASGPAMAAEPPAEKTQAAGKSPVSADPAAVRQVAFDAPVITQAVPPSLARASILESTEDQLSLLQIENLALANNPTLQQLEATIQRAGGLRLQVGLRPNPVVGYQAQQLLDDGTDQHLATVEQEIVTGGKLVLNRRVLDHAVSAQRWELETQRYRIQTDLRLRFFEALAAQRRIELTSDFANVSTNGLELTELRKQANEASQIEVLQAKIQKNEVDLAHKQAEVQLAAARKALAAIVGFPQLPPVPLTGDLGEHVMPIDWSSTLAALVEGSPERKAAQERVFLASAYLRRQEAQSIPNVQVQVAGGIDNGTNSEMLNLGFSVPLPVHNYNQGNVAAARAALCRAVMEVQRLEKLIQSRLAAVSQDFDSAMAAVDQYESEILPSARETLDLAEQAYRAGEFGFLQVLIVRRTYFESNLAYLQAQTELAQANAQVRGFVLTGGLDATTDLELGDDLRGEALDQR